MRTDWQEQEARAQIYGFLAGIFSQEPTRALAESLVKGGPLPGRQGCIQSKVMAEGLGLLGEMDDGGDAEGFFEALRWDYTRLFVGPYRLPAPPYESVYTSPERLVMQASTLRVREKYARAGLQIRNLHHQPDDHVGLELAFMQQLCIASGGALRRGDEARGQALLEQQREFFDEHLSRWLPRFCQDVIEGAQTALYRGAALVCRGFLDLEQEFLSAACGTPETSEEERPGGCARQERPVGSPAPSEAGRAEVGQTGRSWSGGPW